MSSSWLWAQIENELPKPSVWLRADMTSASTWQDQSGNGRHAVAVAAHALEMGAHLNFNETFTFDGVDDELSIPYGLDHLSGMTLMVVFQASDSAEYGLWGVEEGLSRNIQFTTHRSTGPDSTVDYYHNGLHLPNIGTVVQNWGEEPVSNDLAYLALGRIRKDFDLQPFRGRIAEYMVFDKSLSFLERVQVETYLSIKYGIPLSLGNYVSSDEVVLWDSEENSAYGHHITGIGRDDAFLLVQKQATSVHDTLNFLTLGVNRITATNKENRSIINPGDFLLWGDNSMPFTDKPGTGQDSALSVVERKWLIKATGTTVSLMPTVLKVDLSVLPPDSLGYWLVIDRGGSGDFSINNLEYFVADSITRDSVAFFRDIHWDTDLSGGDMFGFVQAKDFLVAVNTLNPPTCDDRDSGEVLVNVVSGNGPFRFDLSHQSADLHHQWTGSYQEEQTGLEPGSYTLKVTDAENQVQIREFQLVMPDGPKVNLGDDRKLTEGSEIVLDASEYIPDTMEVSYYWENSHGFSSTDPSITVFETGIYEVTAIREDNGCDFSDAITISGSTVNRFSVLPTVASAGSTFSISISLVESSDISVSIYDLSGNLSGVMKDQNSAEYHFQGKLDHAGTYLIVLNTAAGIEARKLVVY